MRTTGTIQPETIQPDTIELPTRDNGSRAAVPAAADPPAADPLAGSWGKHASQELLGARYRITDLLGQGGMSTVYGAYDTRLERSVAVKVLHGDGRGAPGVLGREARILAAIRHPNVVTVHALHEDERPPFLVMERIDGSPLHVVVAEQPPTLSQALGYLRQIANGLDAIHSAGLVHGDVKPSNVLQDTEGRLCIIDVGLAPMLERMRPGDILGTPAYIPPERALGAVASRELASRSDVYSFAVLAFELLTGARPFTLEPQAALLHAHALLPAPRPSAVSALAPVFDEPFARALSKTPFLRHPTAGLFVDALERSALAVDALGRALRILVVDDDADTRDLLSAALAIHLRGTLIETASDGALALEAIRRHPPSIAILDLSMPGLAGVDLVRAALALSPMLPIMVCTGHGSGPAWRELKALGVRRFFVKPYEIADLVHAIRQAVEPPNRRALNHGPMVPQ